MEGGHWITSKPDRTSMVQGWRTTARRGVHGLGPSPLRSTHVSKRASWSWAVFARGSRRQKSTLSTSRRECAVPMLMLNGDQDFIFPVQTAQRPLFELFGTPAADKRHVLYPGGHDIIATHRSQVIQEVVGWLDRYLGRVQ